METFLDGFRVEGDNRFIHYTGSPNNGKIGHVNLRKSDGTELSLPSSSLGIITEFFNNTPSPWAFSGGPFNLSIENANPFILDSIFIEFFNSTPMGIHVCNALLNENDTGVTVWQRVLPLTTGTNTATIALTEMQLPMANSVGSAGYFLQAQAPSGVTLTARVFIRI